MIQTIENMFMNGYSYIGGEALWISPFVAWYIGLIVNYLVTLILNNPETYTSKVIWMVISVLGCLGIGIVYDDIMLGIALCVAIGIFSGLIVQMILWGIDKPKLCANWTMHNFVKWVSIKIYSGSLLPHKCKVDVILNKFYKH
jgi:hypothetical protein